MYVCMYITPHIQIACPQCQVTSDFPGVYKVIEKEGHPEQTVVLSGLLCPTPECKGFIDPSRPQDALGNNPV